MHVRRDRFCSCALTVQVPAEQASGDQGGFYFCLLFCDDHRGDEERTPIRRSFIVAQESDSNTSESLVGKTFSLLKQTCQEWLRDKVPQLGAPLAYYPVFSLAPLVLVLLSILGVLFREDPAGAWNKLTQQMSYFLDPSAVQV